MKGFNLKQLSIYSKTLRPTDIDGKRFSPMFGDKYKIKVKPKKQKVDMQVKDIEKAPADHDWARTPIYLEHFQGFSVVMSLMGAEFAKDKLAEIQEKRRSLAER